MRSRLAASTITGPLGFFAAGLLDVSAAWLRWAAGTLAVRLARRLSR